VTYNCNASYLGDGNQEDIGSRPTPGKKSKTLFSPPPSQQINLMMVCAYNPSYVGDIDEDGGPSWLWGKNARPYLKNN
jgi:hypothetical protein